MRFTRFGFGVLREGEWGSSGVEFGSYGVWAGVFVCVRGVSDVGAWERRGFVLVEQVGRNFIFRVCVVGTKQRGVRGFFWRNCVGLEEWVGSKFQIDWKRSVKQAGTARAMYRWN